MIDFNASCFFTRDKTGGEQVKKAGTPGFLVVFLYLFVVAIFVFAGEQTDTAHPIFLETNWINAGSEDFYFDDPDGTKFIWSTGAHYKHANGKYFLNVYTVFGETVFKNYSVRYKDENGDEVEHWWFQIYADGKWNTVETEYYDREFVYDYDPSSKTLRLAAVILILNDKNDKELFRAFVRRNKN